MIFIMSAILKLGKYNEINLIIHFKIELFLYKIYIRTSHKEATLHGIKCDFKFLCEMF